MLKLTHKNQSSEEAAPSEVKPEGKQIDYGQIDAYLSNERTFLVWTITGMSLMGFGIAVAKLRIAITDLSTLMGSIPQSNDKFEISPITMGMMFLVVGLLTILLSAYRYCARQIQIREHRYSHSETFVLLFVFILILLSGTLIIHVLQLRQML
jgi:putative membrane protein